MDTIRGFEAAVDGGYNRQSIIPPGNASVPRKQDIHAHTAGPKDTDSMSTSTWNRRSSYFGNGSKPVPSPTRREHR